MYCTLTSSVKVTKLVVDTPITIDINYVLRSVKQHITKCTM